MLSTTRLVTAGFARLVPVETIIVDEASQIELGGYLTILTRFRRDMKKLVFIGDDKQRESFFRMQSGLGIDARSLPAGLAVAPYGQEDLGSLAGSIFEQEHLRRDAVFLDTQCMLYVDLASGMAHAFLV